MTAIFLATIGLTAFVSFSLGWLIKRRLAEDVYEMARLAEYRLAWCIRAARNALAAPESRRAAHLERYAEAVVGMFDDSNE